MTVKEIMVFRKALDGMGKLPYEIAEITAFNIEWKKMKPGNIGCYSHLKKKLYINEEHRDDPVEFLISTVGHELHHMWQHQKMGMFYFLLCIPPLRFMFLEPSAIDLERKIDEMMGMGGIRDEDKGSSVI